VKTFIIFILLLMRHQEINDTPEDDISIAAHLLALQRECKKASPDSTIIAEKMTRTVSHRLKLIQEKSICDVLEAYPCLRVEKEVCVDISFKKNSCTNP